MLTSNILRAFIPVKQKITDISEVLSSLAKQIESMQKTIDSLHATICQINRTSQGQLKEIRELKRNSKNKDKLIAEPQKRLSKSVGTTSSTSLRTRQYHPTTMLPEA